MQPLTKYESVKKIKPDIAPSFTIGLGVDQIGLVIQYLPLIQQLNMRLVSEQFKLAVEKSLTKMTQIKSLGNLKQFNKFIGKLEIKILANFPIISEIQLPSIYNGDEILKINKNLKKVSFKQFFTRPLPATKFLIKFFEEFSPISLSVYEFRYFHPEKITEEDPESKELNLLNELMFQKLQLKELNLMNVLCFRDCQILKHLPHLVSLSFHVHENDDFFLNYKDISLPLLRMLKIRLHGPNFEPRKIEGLTNFLESIPKVEVLELILDIYNSTSEKQVIFDSFMALPSNRFVYVDLRIANVKNAVKEFQESQLNKTYELLIIENNVYTQLARITDDVMEKLLAFTKILDITNCNLDESNQKDIQKLLNEKRKNPQQFIQTKIIKVSNIDMQISNDHSEILTNYEEAPIVQRNDEFTTLWDSQYYTL